MNNLLKQLTLEPKGTRSIAKRTAQVLGFAGGGLGIIMGSRLILVRAGNMVEGWQIVAIGLAALIFSGVGITGVVLLNKKPRAAFFLMIIAGVGSVTGFNFFSPACFLLGALFAFIAYKKQNND